MIKQSMHELVFYYFFVCRHQRANTTSTIKNDSLSLNRELRKARQVKSRKASLDRQYFVVWHTEERKVEREFTRQDMTCAVRRMQDAGLYQVSRA